LIVIEDACHALGAELGSKRVGSIADMTVFSFHPVKHITTGEGGMVTTENETFAETLRRFRNHGISSDARQRQRAGQWRYEMVQLGFNYRLSDIACALGLEQLTKLDANLVRRRKIAARYRHPYYRDRFHFRGGEFKVAEDAFERLISLPMFHGMTDADVEDVILAVRKVVEHYARFQRSRSL
jgi:dTDP-4-amino-4,6-dideoxygalactose transaminase